MAFWLLNHFLHLSGFSVQPENMVRSCERQRVDEPPFAGAHSYELTAAF